MIGYIKVFGLMSILLLCIAAGCQNATQPGQDAPSETPKPGEQASIRSGDVGVWLAPTADAEGTTISLNYAQREKVAPRVAEIFLRHSANLNYKSNVKGDALEKAQKQLVVQEIEEGKLRVVILSSENTDTIDSGTLAILSFEKSDDKAGRVEILTEQPLFAPEEANQGLLVGDPIEI